MVTVSVPANVPPIAAPMMYDWSGFYIGANGGYGWARQCADVTALNGVAFFFAEGCNDKGGGIVGGQIGYRWQAGTWVFGLEAQGDWANLRTERRSLAFAGETFRSQIDALGLFTGQVGYAWNNTLLYVKGGAAVVNQRFDIFDTVGGIGVAQSERTRWGGVVGVGLEYGFAPNWTAGIEYDYIFRTSDDTVFSTPRFAPITTVTTHRYQHGHWPHQLQVRRLRREILIAAHYILSVKVGRQKCRPF